MYSLLWAIAAAIPALCKLPGKRADGSEPDERISIPLVIDDERRYIAKLAMGLEGSRQEFGFYLSTTSPYTVVAGSSCPACVPTVANDHLYDPSRSPSFHSTNKTGTASLGGQNATGILAKETCALKTNEGKWWTYENQTVVVANSSTLPFSFGAQGILGLGLGKGPGSDFSDTFFGSLFAEHPEWTNFTFGMSLNGAGSSSGDGGVLHLINPDPAFYTGQVTTQPLQPTTVDIPTSTSTEWTVHLDSWKFNVAGGIEVRNSYGGPAVIEPYFPNIVLPQTEALTLYASIKGAQLISGSTGDLTWTVPCDVRMNFTLGFGGVSFGLTESDLLVNKGRNCIGVIQGSANNADTGYIFGGPFGNAAYLIFTIQKSGSVDPNTLGLALRTTRPANASEIGAIVGGIVGAVVGAALLGILAWYLFRKRRADRMPPSALYQSSFPQERALFLPANVPNSYTTGPTQNPLGPYTPVPSEEVVTVELQYTPSQNYDPYLPTPYSYTSTTSPRREKTFSVPQSRMSYDSHPSSSSDIAPQPFLEVNDRSPSPTRSTSPPPSYDNIPRPYHDARPRSEKSR